MRFQYCRDRSSGSRLPHSRLFPGGAVQDYADLFERDQAAIDHFVEARENFLDALDRLDDFEDDGEVLREAQKFVGVIDARSAVTADAYSRATYATA